MRHTHHHQYYYGVVGVFLGIGIGLFLGNAALPKVAALLPARTHAPMRATMGPVGFTVYGVRLDSAGDLAFVPQQGNQFVIVDMLIENNATTSLQIAPELDMYVKDDEGRVYAVTAISSKTEMRSGELLPQDKLREEVGFEVPKIARGLSLYFEPEVPKNIGLRPFIVELAPFAP